MKKQSILILSIIVLSALSACTKYYTPKLKEITKPIDTVVVEELPAIDIDTLQISDTLCITEEVIPIEPEEDSTYQIVFSEEQTTQLILPEYRNQEIDDMKLMFAELDSTEFHYPASDKSYITSPYGWRHRRMHTGVDIKVYTGDDIYAIFDGVVRLAKYYGGYGYTIVIRHDNGLETLYGHSSKLLVDVNDRVKAGQLIALGGSTGRSTGSHLHFEVRVAGNYINPNLVLDTKNHSIQKKNLYITRRNGRLFASNNDSEQEREDAIIEELSIKYYTVKSGDVLSRIASRNGTTVSAICKLNGISSRSTLRIGQRLIVRGGIKPKPKTTTTSKNEPAKKQEVKKEQYTGEVSTYTVKSGDVLGSIAERHNTTVSQLCALNGISSRSTLRVGQKLKVNGKAAQTSTSNVEYYTVKSGDMLSSIAVKCNTTVSKICSLNGISKTTTLKIGQKLKVSGSAASQSAYHTVKSGDVLGSIAVRNNTTITKICQLNGISRNATLKIGQKLRVK